MTGTAQLATVTFLKENNGEGDIDVAELARKNNLTTTGLTTALHSLLSRGVIKKALEGTQKMSTHYILIGDLPAVEKRKTVLRRNNGLGGDILQRAMEQVTTLKATQDQLLAALERIKELEKTVVLLNKLVADQKEELDSTDAQLLNEQKKFLELLQSVEKNSKILSKKIEFDGRGVQRTAGV